ncbi:MAG: S8 family serine peptidase [Prevotella sp.]|nr:S8 family serine peptidase [Prevotella sp.]
MNKYIVIILMMILCVLPSFSHEQAMRTVSYPGGKCYMYRIMLKDKYGTPFSLERPQKYLSEKSIERRKRQNIAIDSTDLPISPIYISEIEDRGIKIVSHSKWNNSLLVRSQNKKLLEGLVKLPFVKGIIKAWTSPDSVTINYKADHVRDEFNPWDSISGHKYGAAEEQIRMLNGIPLHEAGYKGRGMSIAVLDGGFMNANTIPCIKDINILGTRDFVYPKSEKFYGEQEHGTAVLSIMGTRHPYIYIGTAPAASFWLLRCEDFQSESTAEEDYWAEAVEFADSVGVDVINSSLGYQNFDDESSSHTYEELNGITALISRTASMVAGKGMVLINSAGNDGMGTWKKINFPADAKDIITVGAVSPNGINAPFSSIGPTQDGRVKPDVMALGSPAQVISGRGTIISDMGTSFSAPIVAGLVACLWQALRDKTALQIIDIVRKSGNNYKTPNNIFGYGIPDFWKAYNYGINLNNSKKTD